MGEGAGLSWVVSGDGGMELLGFAEGDEEPVARIKMTTKGHWTFTFREFGGSGRVQVRAGDDYNPLDLVENLYGHLKERREAGMDPVHIMVDGDEVEFDSEFAEEWS